MGIKVARALVLVGGCLACALLQGASIVGSRHDLSTPTTPGICVFCHTPHNANTNASIPGAQLWNRAETTQTFILYNSPTMNVATTQPRVNSRLCLSCHDGVLAVTMVNGNLVDTKHWLVNTPGPANFQPNCERCHTDLFGNRRTLILGKDLSNDHPISMPYPTPAQDPSFHVPPNAASGWGGNSPNNVKLFAGWVECGSCHNVHDPAIKPFLRKSNAGSALCMTCHDK